MELLHAVMLHVLAAYRDRDTSTSSEGERGSERERERERGGAAADPAATVATAATVLGTGIIQLLMLRIYCITCII